MTFVLAIFVLTTIFHIMNSPVVPDPILTAFSGGLNFFGPKVFLFQNFFRSKYLGHSISLDQNFSSQIFFEPKSIWPNIFWEPICLEPKIFGLIKVLTKLFGPQNFFDSNLFQDNFRNDFISTKLSSTQLGTTQPQLVFSCFCD